MIMANDLDAHLHHEQFGPDHRFRRCPCGCSLYSYFDPDYEPMRPEWREWSYSCQIRGESELLKAHIDGAD